MFAANKIKVGLVKLIKYRPKNVVELQRVFRIFFVICGINFFDIRKINGVRQVCAKLSLRNNIIGLSS